MATTDVDVANRAFKLIGGATISDFTSGANFETEIANTLYEPLVRAELATYPWSFCKEKSPLDRETDTTVTPNVNVPLNEWDAQYRLPDNFLAIRGLYVQNNAIEFEIFGERAYCNATADDVVVCEHLVRADESIWPDYFTQSMVYRLASDFGGALARDADLVVAFEEKYLFQHRKAKSIDSQSDTAPRVTTNRLISVRR